MHYHKEKRGSDGATPLLLELINAFSVLVIAQNIFNFLFKKGLHIREIIVFFVSREVESCYLTNNICGKYIDIIQRFVIFFDAFVFLHKTILMRLRIISYTASCTKDSIMRYGLLLCKTT